MAIKHGEHCFVRPWWGKLIYVMFAAVVCGPAAWGQYPTADLSRLEPRAALPGTSVEVNLQGANLDGATALWFTHPGITAMPVMLAADQVRSPIFCSLSVTR